ncbi:hypothetical protein V6Z12_A11G245200 [Gossypium hirsutum]
MQTQVESAHKSPTIKLDPKTNSNMKTETNPKCKTKKRPKNKILTCEKIRKIEKQLNLSRSVLISLFLAQSEMNDCRLFPSSDISSSRLFHIPKRSVCHQIYGYPASKLPSFTYFLPFSIWFSRPIPIRLLFCQIWNASYKCLSSEGRSNPLLDHRT